MLPWFRGDPVVEQLGVVNSSLTELNSNLALNCECKTEPNILHLHSSVKLSTKYSDKNVLLFHKNGEPET